MNFYENNLVFQLSVPEYELPVFGFKVGELRLTENNGDFTNLISFSEFKTYLRDNEIKICTFRGKENIHVVRLLESVGFKFISTYNIVICHRKEFNDITDNNSLKVCLANPDDFDRILEIEETVHDFSTFSIDPLIDEKVASLRNSVRVKSHFYKSNHRIYVTRVNNNIVGFIQFIVDIKNKRADTLNAAIHPEYQKMNIGKNLFSGAFKTIFQEGCEIINSDYGTQNIGSAKLHMMCNFKLVDQEIHLRYFENY